MVTFTPDYYKQYKSQLMFLMITIIQIFNKKK